MNNQQINYMKVLNFLEKYPNVFSDFEKAYILDYTKNGYNDDMFPDIIREVYDEVSILPDDKNLYIGFIDMVNDVFNLKNRNILEVGGGVLPRLGVRISKMKSSGRITVYDPRLSSYAMENEKLKLVRDRFNSQSSIRDIDLMIGLMPCKAAEIIIDVATKNKIDFMVALCEGGEHGDEEDYFEDDEEWRDSVIHTARRRVEGTEMGKVKIKYMDKYSNPYPVIYNDRGLEE